MYSIPAVVARAGMATSPHRRDRRHWVSFQGALCCRTLRRRPSCTSSTRRTQARRASFGGTCPFTPAPFLDRFPRFALADATSSAAAHAATNRTANRSRHHTPEHAPARWVWPEQRPDEECEASEGVYNCWMEGCIVPCATQMLRVFGTFCIVAMASNTFGNLLSSRHRPMTNRRERVQQRDFRESARRRLDIQKY